MNRAARVGWALAWAGGALAGCGARSLPDLPNAQARWTLVEMSVDRIFPGGWVGDGRVDPQAELLAIEGWPEEGRGAVGLLLSGLEVEILEIAPRGRASPGETVTLRLRIAHPETGVLYRVEARATGPDVQLLGPERVVVRGGAPAAFRFTALKSGPAGIRVSASDIASPVREDPPGSGRP